MVASTVRTDAVQTTLLLLVVPRIKDVDASTQNSDVVRISTPKPRVPITKVALVIPTNLDAVLMALRGLEDPASRVLINTFSLAFHFSTATQI